jgi:hypothetical protein
LCVIHFYWFSIINYDFTVLRLLRLPLRFVVAGTEGFIATTFAFAGRPLRFAGVVTVATIFAFAGRPLRFAGAVTVATIFAFAGRPLRFAGAVAVVITFLGRPAFLFAGAVAVVITFLGRPAFLFAGAVAVAVPNAFLRLTNVYPCFNRLVFKIVPHPLTNVVRLVLFVLVAITFRFYFFYYCYLIFDMLFLNIPNFF